MKRREDDFPIKLSPGTVKAAIAGDKQAIEEIVLAFDPYIKELSTVRSINEEGEEVSILDEDLMQDLTLKLIEIIPKYKLPKTKVHICNKGMEN